MQCKNQKISSIWVIQFTLYHFYIDFHSKFSFQNSNDVETASFDRRRNIAAVDDCVKPGSNILEINSDSVLNRSWNWPVLFSLRKADVQYFRVLCGPIWYEPISTMIQFSIKNKRFLFGSTLIVVKPVQFREKISRCKFNHSHRWQA